MVPDAPYPYQDRDHERGCTFDDIRRRPLVTYLTVASVIKRMWDMEADAEGDQPPAEAAGAAWEGLRGHLEAMLGCAAEHLSVDRPDHSVRDEWLHERGGGGGPPNGRDDGRLRRPGRPLPAAAAAARGARTEQGRGRRLMGRNQKKLDPLARRRRLAARSRGRKDGGA